MALAAWLIGCSGSGGGALFGATGGAESDAGTSDTAAAGSRTEEPDAGSGGEGGKAALAAPGGGAGVSGAAGSGGARIFVAGSGGAGSGGSTMGSGGAAPMPSGDQDAGGNPHHCANGFSWSDSAGWCVHDGAGGVPAMRGAGGAGGFTSSGGSAAGGMAATGGAAWGSCPSTACPLDAFCNIISGSTGMCLSFFQGLECDTGSPQPQVKVCVASASGSECRQCINGPQSSRCQYVGTTVDTARFVCCAKRDPTSGYCIFG